MGIADSIKSDVSTVISTQWNVRKGQVVPDSTNIALAGGAVKLDATFLYADLANSSKIAKILDRRVAAKIPKSFLATSTRLIRHHDGTILSFDGDRVLGVFVGTTKNTSATKCGLQIKWAVDNAIKAKFEACYDSVKNMSFSISHAVGIDTGTVLIVRAGARGSNDLISIGRAPGLAAKLSDLREAPYKTFISSTIYNGIHDSAKFGGNPSRNMWEQRSLSFAGQNLTIYRSSWHWKP